MSSLSSEKKIMEEKKDFVRIHLYQEKHKTFDYYKVNENNEFVSMNTDIWNQVLGDQCGFKNSKCSSFLNFVLAANIEKIPTTQIVVANGRF